MAADISIYISNGEGEWIMWNWGEIYEQTKRAKCKLDRRQISWITYSFQSFSLETTTPCRRVRSEQRNTAPLLRFKGIIINIFPRRFPLLTITHRINHIVNARLFIYFYIFLSISDQTILISQQRIIFTKFNIAQRYNESNSTPTKFSA